MTDVPAERKRKKSTTTSAGARSAGAQRGKSSKSARKVARRLSSLTAEQQLAEVLALVSPLLELFADVDDVFSEDDAMDAAKRQMGMGRLYRAWKKARAACDPEYDPKRDQRAGRATSRSGVQGPGGVVLQPRRRRAGRSWQA